MGNVDLSSKIILILSYEVNLSLSLKSELQKEVGVVDMASTLHQAVITTILTEPDFIFIQISPENLTGLQLPEILKKVKGIKKNPQFFIFSDKNSKEYLQKKFNKILFVNTREISLVSRQIKTLLEGASSLEGQLLAPWIQYREIEERFPVFKKEKEMDILEKLGQMGILRKK